MCKSRFAVMAIIMFFAFSVISAQETQTQPKKSDGVPVKPGDIEINPGGGIEFKPPQMPEEDKAYYDALRGHMNTGIEFLKKYPNDYRKTTIINKMLEQPVDTVGYNGYMSGKLIFTPDWKYGLFGSNDSRYMLLNMETSKIEKVFKNMGVSKYSPDGTKLIGIGNVDKPSNTGYPYYIHSGCGPYDFNGVINIFNADDGKLIKHIDWKLINDREQAVSVDFTKDSKRILSCSKKAVALWDYETGKQIVEFSVPNANFKVARISDDQKYIACAGSEKSRLINKYGSQVSKGCLYIWDIEKKEPIYSCLEDVNEINEVCFSPDGKWLASTTEENMIVVRNAKTGEHFQSFEGHKIPANKIIFTPDSKLMITSDKYFCRIWDIEARKQNRVIYEIKSLEYVKFEGDDMLVADQYKRWRVSLKDQYQTLDGPDGEIFTVCYSSDGKMFAAGSSYGKIRIWDTSTSEKLLDISADVSSISRVKFMPDNKSLVCSTYAGNVKFYNVSDGTLIKEFQPHEERIYGMDITSDGKLLATGSEDKTAKVWNVADLSLVKTITEHKGEVRGVSFSYDTKYLATGSHDKHILIWNIEDWSLYESNDRENKINDVQYAPNSYEYYSLNDRQEISRRNYTPYYRFGTYYNYYDTKVRKFSVSNDGNKVVCTNDKKLMFVWDKRYPNKSSSAPYLILENKTNNLNAVCFSPDGNTILAGDFEEEWDYSISRRVKNSKIRLWNANSVQLTKQYVGPRGNAYSSDISTDGKYIAYAYYDALKPTPNNVEIWSMKTGACLHKLEGHENNGLRVKFSPDGKILASGTFGKYEKVNNLHTHNSEIKLWEVETGKLLRTFKFKSTSVRCLEFSPDGKYILGGGGCTQHSDDNDMLYYIGELNVWDVETGELKHALPGHFSQKTVDGCDYAYVMDAKFSPDGKSIVSICNKYDYRKKDKLEQYKYDGEIIVWNAETGEQECKIDQKDTGMFSVDFTPDGKYFVTCESKKIGYNEEVGFDVNQGYINFRDIKTGKVERTLTDDNAMSMSADFSPDGKTILSYVRYKRIAKDRAVSGDRMVLWDIESGKQFRKFDPYRGDYGVRFDYTPDGKYIIVNGSSLYLTLENIEEQVGKESLYKHLFNYNTAANQIDSCFGYSLNGNKDYRKKYFDWEAIAKNYPDKMLSEVQELFSMDRMYIFFWYFSAWSTTFENENWLTEKDGEFYATCKFRMRVRGKKTDEFEEWYLTVKARLNKKAFTWQIVDMGNFPLDLMGLSKITIKFKDTNAGYWMAQEFLVTPKQREALEAKLKENPEYIPQEYYVEFYSKGSTKRLEKLEK